MSIHAASASNYLHKTQTNANSILRNGIGDQLKNCSPGNPHNQKTDSTQNKLDKNAEKIGKSQRIEILQAPVNLTHSLTFGNLRLNPPRNRIGDQFKNYSLEIPPNQNPTHTKLDKNAEKIGKSTENRKPRSSWKNIHAAYMWTSAMLHRCSEDLINRPRFRESTWSAIVRRQNFAHRLNLYVMNISRSRCTTY